MWAQHLRLMLLLVRLGCTIPSLRGQPGAPACAVRCVCGAQILRPMYSNPPLHGSLLAQTILADPELNALWRKEVKVSPRRLSLHRLAQGAHPH